MTAKEKAKELVKKYEPIVYSIDNYGDYDGSIAFANAKSCALIAVDEIIDAYCYLNVEVLHTQFGEILNKINGEIRIKYYEFVIYWTEVKKEIINL